MTDATARIGMLATEAIGLLIDAVDQIRPQSWDQPSNLDGWSVRDLVGHATGSAAKILTLVEDGEVWGGPSQPADWVCDDPAARLRQLAARLQDALPRADLDAMRVSPEGKVPLRRALTYPVSDLALHSWLVESVPEGCCGDRAASGRPNPRQRIRRRPLGSRPISGARSTAAADLKLANQLRRKRSHRLCVGRHTVCPPPSDNP